MDLGILPPLDQPCARLRVYQYECERERAEAALKVPEKERTQAERNAIAYSTFGSAPGCHCGH